MKGFALAAFAVALACTPAAQAADAGPTLRVAMLSDVETLDPALDAPAQLRRTARFYFDHYANNSDYFQIFWAIENQAVIGQLPTGVVDEVSRLWETCVNLVAEIVRDGVDSGRFVACDAWEVAHVLWTLANGLIQTETSTTRRRLRRRRLDEAFDDAMEIVLRGIVADRGDS